MSTLGLELDAIATLRMAGQWLLHYVSQSDKKMLAAWLRNAPCSAYMSECDMKRTCFLSSVALV